MNKQEFVSFCHEQFVRYGFQKKRSMYFRQGCDGILCGIGFKKSSYSRSWVVMYYYYLNGTTSREEPPSPYNYDLVGYINVMSKETVRGKTFLTGTIDYERYTQGELDPYFSEAFDKYILPSLQNGKGYLLDHNDHLSSHHEKNKALILEQLSNKVF